jgi:L-threonylcarbamoyladenylate synthase
LVATSANFSEDPFPTHFGTISSELLRKVDYIVKYKQDQKNMHDPSPIVRLSEKEELIFIRS